MLGKFITMFNMVFKTFNGESTWSIVQWSLEVLKRWNYPIIFFTLSQNLEQRISSKFFCGSHFPGNCLNAPLVWKFSFIGFAYEYF